MGVPGEDLDDPASIGTRKQPPGSVVPADCPKIDGAQHPLSKVRLGKRRGVRAGPSCSSDPGSWLLRGGRGDPHLAAAGAAEHDTAREG